MPPPNWYHMHVPMSPLIYVKAERYWLIYFVQALMTCFTPCNNQSMNMLFHTIRYWIFLLYFYRESTQEKNLLNVRFVVAPSDSRETWHVTVWPTPPSNLTSVLSVKKPSTEPPIYTRTCALTQTLNRSYVHTVAKDLIKKSISRFTFIHTRGGLTCEIFIHRHTRRSEMWTI